MPATACVTGATGFIGSHVVQRLLDQGYEVRGTVRDAGSARSGFLSDLDGSDRLSLFEADLMDPGSFDDAIAGCDLVFHVASPLQLTVDDPQRNLVDPAVNGTEAVLDASRRAGTVKRVVQTSSVAALGGRRDGQLVDHNTWNTHSSLTRGAYAYSKTVAEKAAWAFMEKWQPDFDLIAVHPVFVWGPALGPRLSESTRMIRDMYTGKWPALMDLTFNVVDVRDLAEVHQAAAESQNASGRYIACAGQITMRDSVAVARSTHDHPRLPRFPLDNAAGSAVVRLLAYVQPKGVRQFLHANLRSPTTFDASRVRDELGVTYRPLDETIADTVQDQIQRGHIAA